MDLSHAKGGSTSLERKQDTGRVWLIAWAMTLLLHLVAFVFFQKMPPFKAAAVSAAEPAPLRLTFAKPAPESADDEPHLFSELPPDRADPTAPDKPEFLSNVTSRARDRVPGGDTNLPRMQGDADVPLVKLESGKTSPSRPSSASPPSPQADASQEQQPPQDQSATGTGSGRSVLQRSNNTPLVRLSNEEAFRGADGNADTDQPEMQNADGNASLLGDVSLNTTAWDYAPWLQRFGIQLKERWYPPPAYLLGILKEGGWAQFEVEISKSGKLLRLDLLEEQGHPSLIRSAKSALSSMNPIEPLPGDFPEPTLILRVRMIYPKYRPR